VLAISGSIQLCVSANVYAEYEEVVHCPRLRLDKELIARILSVIRVTALWVVPKEIVRACADSDDDIFVVCAIAAGADYLVAGNTRHFPSVWAGTKIVTPRQFLTIFSVGTDPQRSNGSGRTQ
jgi:putative PIN family toxin of toxin-antitoxin system